MVGGSRRQGARRAGRHGDRLPGDVHEQGSRGDRRGDPRRSWEPSIGTPQWTPSCLSSPSWAACSRASTPPGAPSCGIRPQGRRSVSSLTHTSGSGLRILGCLDQHLPGAHRDSADRIGNARSPEMPAGFRPRAAMAVRLRPRLAGAGGGGDRRPVLSIGCVMTRSSRLLGMADTEFELRADQAPRLGKAPSPRWIEPSRPPRFHPGSAAAAGVLRAWGTRCIRQCRTTFGSLRMWLGYGEVDGVRILNRDTAIDFLRNHIGALRLRISCDAPARGDRGPRFQARH